MKELSLNILDILENSIHAGATNIVLSIEEDTKEKDRLFFSIQDNGKGMDSDFLKTVFDPFTTTSTTKKVGLGLPLLKAEAEMAGGGASITSEVGKGTFVSFWFQHSHWDRPPMGDIAGTVLLLFMVHSTVDFFYTHRVNEYSFSVSTKQLKEVFDDVPLHHPSAVKGIQEYLTTSIQKLHGGKNGQD
jgi:hypothetical protein